jgi:hypothetical protein
MPSYDVDYVITIEYEGTVTVEAETEDDAREIVENMKNLDYDKIPVSDEVFCVSIIEQEEEDE